MGPVLASAWRSSDTKRRVAVPMSAASSIGTRRPSRKEVACLARPRFSSAPAGRIPAGQEPQRDGLSQGIRRALRLVLPGDVIVFAPAIRVTRQGDRLPDGHSLFLAPELPDVIQDLVQALSGDVLHRVIADAVVLAVVEDADDVGVVQPGRRAGLGVESAEVVRRGCDTADASP